MLAFIVIALIGCVAGVEKVGKVQDLPLMKHSYSKSKVLAYKNFGFDPDDLPSGVDDITDSSPTEIKVNLYIADNQRCKFTYIASKRGAKEQETRTSSFSAYLSDKGVLLEAQCIGKDSNVDYKISVYANGVEYDRIGNLSFLAESHEF